MSRALDRALLQHEAMPEVSGSPIVESGSNANGGYIKYADGTMICTGVVSTGVTGTVSYPAIFLNAPRISGGTNRNANSVTDYWGLFNDHNGSSFTYRWAVRVDTIGYYTAIGRWY